MMTSSLDFTMILLLAVAAVSVGAIIIVLLMPSKSDELDERVGAIAAASKADSERAQAAAPRNSRDARRRQVQETLKQLEERERQRRKRLTLRTLIMQADVDLTVRRFWLMSAASGALLFALPFFFGIPLIACLLSGAVGLLGLPRWVLQVMRRRRQAKFLEDFADAIDVMVRGLKAGLPVSDAMRVIASEVGPPVGPEFVLVVEGQRVGITAEQGIQRMFERMPLQEVGFLGIVMSIQSKTGGNLSEALTNLSKVLRERKKMKGKIRAYSQEAKTSAAIIAGVPFLQASALMWFNFAYLEPLFSTRMGNIMLIGVLLWMGVGILVMRKLINFEI